MNIHLLSTFNNKTDELNKIFKDVFFLIEMQNEGSSSLALYSLTIGYVHTLTCTLSCEKRSGKCGSTPITYMYKCKKKRVIYHRYTHWQSVHLYKYI